MAVPGMGLVYSGGRGGGAAAKGGANVVV